jgi:hypothetical protein
MSAQLVDLLVDLLDVAAADCGVVEDRLDGSDFLLDILKLLRVSARCALRLDLLCLLDNDVSFLLQVIENVVPVVEALAAW